MKTYTPSNECMIACTCNSGDYCEMSEYRALRRKAHELAEAILMGWDNAVDVARKFVGEDLAKWEEQ